MQNVVDQINQSFSNIIMLLVQSTIQTMLEYFINCQEKFHFTNVFLR